MRVFMIVAFATMLVLSAWANSMDSAGAGQTGPAATAKSAAGLAGQPGY
jgi:hypothetical protein